MKIENRMDSNGKKRIALTFFNTEYETERDYRGSRMTLWPNDDDLKELILKKDEYEYCSWKTDPGPMGSNMYPRVKGLEPTDCIPYSFKDYLDDWTKTTKRRYDQMVRASWKKESKIVKVIFNDPATIVYWIDGTKTVVKSEGEKFDPEKGLAMAISKKLLGNNGNYYNEFKKWLSEE